ncbi:MAG: hypothetical protein A2075_11725 [Geobacteraceae bacterium GWC2_58_44]|nr:MAG: hypothetical protein A2075_11725 [Geobacteraceae bacterium GWC2_58_44]
MPKKSSVLLFFLLLASYLVCHAEQARPGGRTLRYRITSRGFGVGELKTVIAPVQHAGSRAVRFHSDLAIDANLLLFKVSTRSSEDAVIGEHGTLSYRRQGEDSGKSSTVDATLEGGAFRFKMTDIGASRSVAVPRSSYDFTTMDCPETTMQREGEIMEVRLLDMEHARVVKRKFHWVRSEEVEVGGKRLRCRVVDFSDANNSCRRWVSKDEAGVVIVRQDGTGKGGNYSLRVVSVSDGPA